MGYYNSKERIAKFNGYVLLDKAEKTMFVDALSTFIWPIIGLFAGTALVLIYLIHVNYLLKGVPSEAQKLSGPRWTTEQLKRTYDELDKEPIDYTSKIPPRLDRRYVVTGGNGKTTSAMHSSTFTTNASL